MVCSKQFEMKNNTLHLRVDLERPNPIRSLSLVGSSVVSNVDRGLFSIHIYDRIFTHRDFSLVSVEQFEDAKEELITAHYTLPEQELGVKVHFINDRADTLRVLFQVWDGYKHGVPYAAFMRVPLLHELNYQGETDCFLAPGCQFRSAKGKKIIMPLRDYQYSNDIRPPMVVLGEDLQHGFSVTFPALSDLNNPGCVQNQSKFLAMKETEREIRDDEFIIVPDSSYTDTLELLITGINRGWPEAFDRYRDFWASSYDFSEYDREDLKWFNETAIHNFVFFYGKEGFNRSEKKIDVEGLIRQGEEFGGYDTVTIWNQYPRLGIDKRTQWDFHDDFPGGREAIRKAVDQFHEHGVRVLLPYIPWDQGPNETTETMGDEFAKLVKDTDADGYQLDTMYDLPYNFRAKCDAVKPGVLLQTQFHPAKNHPMEFLTSSWDEFWRQDPMPEVDVLRFLLPQHIAPQIARWSRYEDKTLVIKRAMFGGAPMVIWQDIFGRWMPFAEDQKRMIKQWKQSYLEYRSIFQGSKPLPIYTVYSQKQGVYCNAFFEDDGSRSIYSFYNETESPLTAEVLLWQGAAKSAKTILGACDDAAIHDNKLSLTVPAGEVIQVLVCSL